MRSGRQEPTAAGPEGIQPPVSAQIRGFAEEDHRSVVSLTQMLVQVPSRGGLDPYDPLVDLLSQWLAERGLVARQLHDEAIGQTVGLVCDVPGAYPGPRYVLDACLDTAPFGDLSAWRHPPTSGVIEDGWLYGRGAADSKAAVAIFAHVAARLREQAARLRGTLTLLLDADEHTGRFGGAKCYFGDAAAAGGVAGVMIGYPGLDQLVIGGRGFLRAQVTLLGRAGHTGSTRSTGNENAVGKAAYLIQLLTRHSVPAGTDAVLGLGPKLTVTAVQGGEGYSVIPDRCAVNVDVRLTVSFAADAAKELIEQAVACVDEKWPAGRASTVAFQESWPAYRLEDSAPIRVALTQAARRHLPHVPPAKVAGPSNIGNYLARLGIGATAGLGVRYEGLHGTDERIDLSTIPMVQATYHEAILALLSP